MSDVHGEERSIADFVPTPRRLVLYVVLLGFLVFYLLPIESGLSTAFKTADSFTGIAPYVPPPIVGEFTLGQWADAAGLLASGFVNSLLFVVPATILSGLGGSMAAYGLTLVNWRGQVGVYALFVAGIFIPYQSVLVPLTQFWTNIVPLRELFELPAYYLPLVEGHHWKLLALVITHTAYGIPICTLLFRAHYKKLSDEMIEAARLDGATLTTIYKRIVLPLSIPMFAVVFIYQFTQVWNDLLFGLTVVQSGPASIVTMELAGLGVSESATNFPLRMAGAFVAALPTLLVYIVFGDKFAKGVTA